MKSFTISEALIYNPTIKSMKKKPIESDIQEAKIMAYYPSQSQIQQKCNTVGMAEGVYEFSRSLQTQKQKQSNQQGNRLVIFMDSCCLVSKQVEESTWLFLKIQYYQKQNRYFRYGEKQDEEEGKKEPVNCYYDAVMTEKLALQILDHVQLSFNTFYGKFSMYFFKQCLPELQKTFQLFMQAYHDVNKLEETKKLDIYSYLLKSIRVLPLDINSNLKFQYFKNVMESYDKNVAQILIFSNGLLAYSSLPKLYTQFWSKYFFGTGELFKYESNMCFKKLRVFEDMALIDPMDKYGTFYNTVNLGFGSNDNRTSVDSRSSISVKLAKKSQKKQDSVEGNNEDLLGLDETQQISLLPEVYMTLPVRENPKCVEEQKYFISYFFERKMLFVTFYRKIFSTEQIIFQNRFYHDNIDKFLFKINEVVNGVLSQTDIYKFIYCNLSTYTGKSSIDKWTSFCPQIRYVMQQLVNGDGDGNVVATTYQNYWVYGIHRLNRLLILLIPSDTPLHRLQQFCGKMYKQYFFKAYM